MLDINQIIQLSNAGLGAIAINTRTVSEDVALAHLVCDLATPRNINVLLWDAEIAKNVTPDGRGRLQQVLLNTDGVLERREGPVWTLQGHPVQSILKHITAECEKFITERVPPKPTLFILQDLYAFIAQSNTDSGIERSFINACKALKRSHHRLVLFHENVTLPAKFRDLVEEIENPLPSELETRDILMQRIAAIQASVRGAKKPKNLLSEDDTKKMVRALQGMTSEGMDDAIQLAAIQNGKLDAGMIPKVLERKKRAFAARGVEYAQPPDVPVQGMPILEEWAHQQLPLLEPDAKEKWNLDFPRGCLLVGEAGTGKSLAAKTISQVWGLPIIILDVSRLMQKELGESERNFREIIAAAESMSPCILMIDEADKAFGNIGSGDGGTSNRIFSYLLTWMQDHTSEVFVIATANEPNFKPELLRRFTQRFYCDLPSASARKDIFRVQMERRKLQPFDEARLELLSRRTQNFSGDEIQIIVTTCATNSYANGTPGEVSLEDFYTCIDRTPAQFKNNPPRLAKLRQWAAAGNAVFVDPEAQMQNAPRISGDRQMMWDPKELELSDE